METITVFGVVGGLLITVIYILLITLLKTINRITEANKQLLIVVAGKEAKPEALRALVASDKAPRKNLPGIATGKKKDTKKPTNMDCTLTIGGNDGV